MISTYGQASPCLSFIGHTDVVPSGDINEWSSNPFELTNKDNVPFFNVNVLWFIIDVFYFLYLLKSPNNQENSLVFSTVGFLLLLFSV